MPPNKRKFLVFGMVIAGFIGTAWILLRPTEHYSEIASALGVSIADLKPKQYEELPRVREAFIRKFPLYSSQNEVLSALLELGFKCGPKNAQIQCQLIMASYPPSGEDLLRTILDFDSDKKLTGVTFFNHPNHL
jgi:hypothetical protein